MIPESLHWLFWEIDAASVDLTRHRDYVILRVMERGDWNAMRWLAATFTESQLADVLRHKGNRLPARERAFWSVVARLQVDVGAGGGRPQWAG